MRMRPLWLQALFVASWLVALDIELACGDRRDGAERLLGVGSMREVCGDGGVGAAEKCEVPDRVGCYVFQLEGGRCGVGGAVAVGDVVRVRQGRAG